jgi:hypothetical protein
MSIALVVIGVPLTLFVALLRGVAVDEARGRVERRITESVESKIAALPPQLQDEWADEWRAELAAVISMPITAAQFARGLEDSIGDLLADAAFAPTTTRAGTWALRMRGALRVAEETLDTLRLAVALAAFVGILVVWGGFVGYLVSLVTGGGTGVGVGVGVGAGAVVFLLLFAQALRLQNVPHETSSAPDGQCGPDAGLG